MPQLESIIGKLKAQKYGSRILEVVDKYKDANPPENTSSNGKLQGGGKRRSKIPKTINNSIYVASSDEDACLS